MWQEKDYRGFLSLKKECSVAVIFTKGYSVSKPAKNSQHCKQEQSILYFVLQVNLHSGLHFSALNPSDTCIQPTLIYCSVVWP